MAGADRALQDLDVITDWVRNHPDVDTTKMIIGGVSRGGILAIAHIAQRPEVYTTAINFVGGWIAEGCGDHAQINTSLFVRSAAYPGQSLWLYGENDTFYSLAYSRGNFDNFSAAGGLATFQELRRANGLNGHFVINDLALWAPLADDFLSQF